MTTLAANLVTRIQGLLNLNETLATTVPSALGKEPTARGPFDTIAIQHLQEDLDKCLTEWKTQIHESEVVKAKHAANVHSARETFKAAKEQQLKSSEAFSAIRTEIDESTRLLREAKADIRKSNLQQGNYEKKVKSAQDKLDAFKQGPLSVFAELRDRDQLEVEINNPSGATDVLTVPGTGLPMEVA